MFCYPVTQHYLYQESHIKHSQLLLIILWFYFVLDPSWTTIFSPLDKPLLVKWTSFLISLLAAFSTEVTEAQWVILMFIWNLVGLLTPRSKHILVETGVSYPLSVWALWLCYLEDRCCSFHLSIFSSGCAQGTAHLHSCHGEVKHSRMKPPWEQGTFTWNHHSFRGCFEKHMFLVVPLVSLFLTARLHLSELC